MKNQRIQKKIQRVLILKQAKELGLLEGLTLREIGNALGCDASTVMRALRDIDEIAQIETGYLDALKAQQGAKE